MLRNDEDCNPKRMLDAAFACASAASAFFKPDLFSILSIPKCAAGVVETAAAYLSKIQRRPEGVAEFGSYSSVRYARIPVAPPGVQRGPFLREPLEREELIRIRMKLARERSFKADVEKISIDARCNKCGHLQQITTWSPISEKQFDFVCETCGVKAYLNFPFSSARHGGISS